MKTFRILPVLIILPLLISCGVEDGGPVTLSMSVAGNFITDCSVEINGIESYVSKYANLKIMDTSGPHDYNQTNGEVSIYSELILDGEKVYDLRSFAPVLLTGKPYTDINLYYSGERNLLFEDVQYRDILVELKGNMEAEDNSRNKPDFEADISISFTLPDGRKVEIFLTNARRLQ